MGYLSRSLSRSGLLLVSMLGLVLSTASVSHAADSPDVAWAYDLAHELMSPFCPGRTLAECPSPNAGELRLWIINQAAAGASEAEVRQMLDERFGDVLRATPRADDGWGVSAYAVPIGFLVVGAPVAIWIIRRLRGGQREAPAPGPVTPAVSVDPELERQLERELGEI